MVRATLANATVPFPRLIAAIGLKISMFANGCFAAFPPYGLLSQRKSGIRPYRQNVRTAASVITGSIQPFAALGANDRSAYILNWHRR